MTDENKISWWRHTIKKKKNLHNLSHLSCGRELLICTLIHAIVCHHDGLVRAQIMSGKSQKHAQTCAVLIERKSEVLHFRPTHVNRMNHANL